MYTYEYVHILVRSTIAVSVCNVFASQCQFSMGIGRWRGRVRVARALSSARTRSGPVRRLLDGVRTRLEFVTRPTRRVRGRRDRLSLRPRAPPPIRTCALSLVLLVLILCKYSLTYSIYSLLCIDANSKLACVSSVDLKLLDSKPMSILSVQLELQAAVDKSACLLLSDARGLIVRDLFDCIWSSLWGHPKHSR